MSSTPIPPPMPAGGIGAMSSSSSPSPTTSNKEVLNGFDCLSLESITASFSAPITEEHAFAIIYECMKTLGGVVRDAPKAVPVGLSVVAGTADIMLHKEGRVHESTFLETLNPSQASSSGDEGAGASASSKSTGIRS